MSIEHYSAPGTVAQRGPDTAPVEHRVAHTDLVAWAAQARAAAEFAELVVYTDFCPQPYRRKPAEAAAVILAGGELGFSPMASLRTFDNIQGVASPKAITQRAVVQSRGHAIWVVEADATRAVVRGQRKGSSEVVESVWTIERADQAGFVKKNPNYRSQPQSMLVARATAECARWVASDALLGMPYSSEELLDDHMLTAASPEQIAAGAVAPSRAARGRGRTTAALLTGEPETDAEPDVEPDAEDNGETLAIDSVTREDVAPAGGENRDELWRDIRAAFDSAGVDNRDDVMRVMSRLVEGFPIDGDTAQLTNAELRGLLDSLVDLGVDGIASIVSDRGEPAAESGWPDAPAPGSGTARKGGKR